MSDSLRTRWYASCTACPNFCRVNRLEGQHGRCRVGDEIRIAAADLHFGEERVLVGRGGSGTIFFSSCNLRCVFCQNHEISHGGVGRTVSSDELVTFMERLEYRGATNINLVTPTHMAPAIAEALVAARRRGMRLPVVYNCGGYENPELLGELDGLIDIYMPDTKFHDESAARRFLGVSDYPEYNRAALREMQRQVGSLRIDGRGVATRGLLVRHLVMPGFSEDSRAIMDFLVSEISSDTYVNIMGQYRPAYRAWEHRGTIDRAVRRDEVETVRAYARSIGLTRLDER